MRYAVRTGTATSMLCSMVDIWLPYPANNGENGQ
jgi:hypothetical protein